MTDKQREAAKAHFEAMAAWSQAKRDEEAADKARNDAYRAWGDALHRRIEAEKRLTKVTAKYEEAMKEDG